MRIGLGAMAAVALALALATAPAGRPAVETSLLAAMHR